jgi:hypothetical protein
VNLHFTNIKFGHNIQYTQLCLRSDIQEGATKNRGNYKIGNCILTFIAMLHCKYLVIYSDECPEQNKKCNIHELRLHLIHSNSYESIDHSFIISSHTHFLSDCELSEIENISKNRTQAVYDHNVGFELYVSLTEGNHFMLQS